MKKKIKLLGILFLLSLVSLNAQTFYYYKGEKINLTVDRNCIHNKIFCTFALSNINQQFKIN